MTPARHGRKRSSGFSARCLSLAIALVLGIHAGIPALAATTERIVTGWRTGLALHGIDPVAYFTDAKPMLGRPEIEYAFGGAVWRFRNEGNRAAFRERPDIYMPRFGGYDPTALLRGVTIPGYPEFWLILEDRLYIFASSEARDTFAADPEGAVPAAQKSWREVIKTLVP